MITKFNKGFTLIEYERPKGVRRNESFTLIELLIVIGILAILMGAIIAAINPARQFSQARNSQRWSHISSILSAVYQNMVANKGTFTCAGGSLPVSATGMKASGGYDICGCLAPIYLPSMPFDPSSGSYASCSGYDSDYTIYQNASTTRITVASPSAELSENISLTR
ncbi:MAG: prepilin-type N-terminal cleavage/methylation domain-containing protein [bacterium]|nr:prepilin-type N-terminal cleavage/methylation domain-containing protein [bacterium]